MDVTQTLEDTRRTLPPGTVGPVLVAVTPTARESVALTMAVWVAQRLQRELHVLTVTETPEMTGTAEGAPVSPAFSVKERDRIATQWRSLLDRRLPETLAARLDVIPGFIASTIVETATARGASVIVVGARPKSILGRIIHADHDLAIADLAVQPVLIVPRTVTPPLHRAMIATDFGSADLHAIELVIGLLGPDDRVVLAHVNESAPRDRNVADEQLPFRRESTAARYGQMESFVREMPTAIRARVDMKVLSGSTSAALVACARQMSADLVVCGRRRRSHWLDLITRRTSTTLVRRANGTMLVVRGE